MIRQEVLSGYMGHHNRACTCSQLRVDPCSTESTHAISIIGTWV